MLAKHFSIPPQNTPKNQPLLTVLLASDKSTSQDPAVAILSVTPSSLARGFQFIFQDWFNQNIGQFNNIFPRRDAEPKKQRRAIFNG